MRKISLVDLGESFRDRWFDELILKSRAFPLYQDGLKEPTRALLTETARLSKFTKNPVSASTLVRGVTNYKEVGEKNVEKNLYRFTSNNNPLIRITEITGGSNKKGLNMITGGNLGARYVSVALTDLGEYVLRYKDYFEEVPSEMNNGVNKYKAILTPVPLGLLIPQVNLADGLSNDAPNLNILQTLDAMILHLQKDKQTTTAELAEIITGVEIGQNHIVLSSNQGLYDLIERGIMKNAVISPIEFFKNEFVIKGLPFKTFGKTIANELMKAKQLGLKNSPRGFKSFVITGILAEDSKDSIIAVTFDLRRGYRLKDVKEEVYSLTSMNERVVYENICLDLELETSEDGKHRPLTIKSVRQVLDYHYDIGFTLKRREIERLIYELEKERVEKELAEKLTRPIVREVVSRLVPEPNRDNLAKKYLNQLYDIMYNHFFAKTPFPDYELINELFPKHFNRMAQIMVERAEGGTPSEEIILEVLDEEVPRNFTQDEIQILWDRKYSVLYDLNKRKQALDFLREFQARLDSLNANLNDHELMKAELIGELTMLRNKYKDTNANLSTNLFALKDYEREERMQYIEKLQAEYSTMQQEMPVNVLIDSDFNAQLSFSKHANMVGLAKVYECTTKDNLLILVNNGKSYKVPVRSLKTTPVALTEGEEILDVLVDAQGVDVPQVYVFATSRGRVGAVDGTVSYFTTQTFSITLEKDEKIIYSNLLPKNAHSNKIAILVKNTQNLYKQKALGEISVKNRFSNFFALFAGDYSITDANDVIIMDALDSSIPVWDRGPKKVILENGFKRNVSKGAFMGEGNYTLVRGKVPVVNDHIIPSLNTLSNNDCFEDMSDVLFSEVNHISTEKVGEFKIEDIRFVPLRKSVNRMKFQMPFPLTDERLAVLLQIYS